MKIDDCDGCCEKCPYDDDCDHVFLSKKKANEAMLAGIFFLAMFIVILLCIGYGIIQNFLQ